MRVTHQKEFTKCDICGDVINHGCQGFSVPIDSRGDRVTLAYVSFSVEVDGKRTSGMYGSEVDLCEECIQSTIISKIYAARRVRKAEEKQ